MGLMITRAGYIKDEYDSNLQIYFKKSFKEAMVEYTKVKQHYSDDIITI